MPQIYPNANPKRINTRPPKLFVVELTVGEKVFHAEGRTRQQAKHSAATQGKLSAAKSAKLHVKEYI